MRRLTPQEIDELKRQLADWRAPQSMLEIVDAAMDTLGSTNLFNQGGLAFLRDGWIAATFGLRREAERVRLVLDSWPDFELQVGGKIEAFEAVEADNPGRRRGLEYREGLDEIREDPVENWIARAEGAPDWLHSACLKKARKRYGARANLVIYLNMGEFGIRQSEVEASFPSATEPATDAFDSVWVLWKEQTYQVWPRPNMSQGVVEGL